MLYNYLGSTQLLENMLDRKRISANSDIVTRKLRNVQLLSGCGFVQNKASLSLSCDRRIKIEQTNKANPSPNPDSNRNDVIYPENVQKPYFAISSIFGRSNYLY